MKDLPDIEQAKREAFEVLQSTLERAGDLLNHEWVGRPTGSTLDPGYDLKWRFRVTAGQGRGEIWWIHAEIKTVVYPQQAKAAIWGLQKSVEKSRKGQAIYPILIAPHITDSVAKLCREEGIGYLDLSGNGHIEFGGIWIERSGQPRKYKPERSAKSLFTPKASRILKVLLQGPLRSYLVVELANRAGVSLGHVSKVRKVLLEQDFAEETEHGIRIKNPDQLLRQWVRADRLHERIETQEYSTLETGPGLAQSIAQYLTVVTGGRRNEYPNGPIYTLGFAASLRAPHNVATTLSAYLSQFPDEEMLTSIGARKVTKGGGNLLIFVPKDFEGIALDAHQIHGLQVVSDLQLYLDLQQGEPNGQEQADVLRNLEDFNGGWS